MAKKSPQYTAFITLKRKIPKEKKWKMIYWWDNLLHLRNSGWLERILKWWFTDTEKTQKKAAVTKWNISNGWQRQNLKT